MSDVHHFKQTVNGGELIYPSGLSNAQNVTGGCIIRLTDLPLYQQMGPNFEFARLNKCTIEFWPKANMQLNQFTAAGAVSSFSPSGRLITAVDQVPFYSDLTTSLGTFLAAPSWANDTSNDTGVTVASFVKTAMTADYIRGIQGSREKELYKKHSITFFPAFYDYVMTGIGTGAITSVTNVIPNEENVTGGGLSTNGCVERKIKKWVSINNIGSNNSSGIAINVGPLYFGPVYAMDVNVDGSGATSIPLFDIVLKYSISFKRVRGV